MSKIADFYSKVVSDTALFEDYKKIVAEQKIPSDTKFEDLSDGNIEALLPLAKKAGFTFTVEEIRAGLPKKQEGELSDDELDAVAGGQKTPEGVIIIKDIEEGDEPIDTSEMFKEWREWR
ncbi:MAG: Nif11-like leader peptide family RiPP precursor [Clostridiales bacterium]|nr:Nif11-like leader peptide family RiPP precursor [Clostridiales bacterium]